MLEHILQMPKKIIESIGIMLQNKKLHIITILSIVLALVLTSCGYSLEPADVIVEYQVPFAKSGNHFNEIKLMDSDEFGRELYSYKSAMNYDKVFRDYIEDDNLNIAALMYIIVQKRDNDFVYCYDDYCYVYVKSFEDDNGDIINSLKERNDWGKPYKDEKITVLSSDTASNKLAKYKNFSAEEEAVTMLEQMVGYDINDYYLDEIFLENATPIFVLREVISYEKPTFGKTYVLYVPDNKENAIYAELSKDFHKWNEDIHNFKKTLISK